jgi:hypothetical protein
MLAGMVASLAALIIDRHSFYDRLRHQYVHDLLKEDPAPLPSQTKEENAGVSPAGQ